MGPTGGKGINEIAEQYDLDNGDEARLKIDLRTREEKKIRNMSDGRANIMD